MANPWEQIIQLENTSTFDISANQFGNRILVAHEDGTVSLYKRSEEDFETFEKENTITAHEGPVWKTTWAHPKFGSIFASCSFDKTVKIWRQTGGDQWSEFYGYDGHQASVNDIEFGNAKNGFSLFCCSTDGSISIINEQNLTSDPIIVKVGNFSLTSITLLQSGDNQETSTIIVGTKEGSIYKITDYYNEPVVEEICTESHSDIVRALQVTEQPSGFLSASDDGKIIFWTEVDGEFQAQNQFSTDSHPYDITVTLTGAKVFVHCKDNVLELEVTPERDNFTLVGQ